MRNSVFILGLFLILFFGCTGNEQPVPLDPEVPEPETDPEGPTFEVFPRDSKIPADAVKITPETDNYPPILHSDEWEEPVPVAVPITSAGAEDSAFIRPDGSEMFFFFTPDVDVPVEKQLIDGTTGIYSSKRVGNRWSESERIILNYDISLDGCQFIQGNRIWFCSARVGNNREIDWYVADYQGGEWKNWQLAEDLNSLEAGELHISSDGNEVYFHADMEGGLGGYDLYVSKKEDGAWLEPENLVILNSPETDGWPYLTQDKSELWFTRTYLGTPAIYRSIKDGDEWGEPELIISQFAGEPTLDNEGNLYFTHHFYENGNMIEADIYVSNKK